MLLRVHNHRCVLREINFFGFNRNGLDAIIRENLLNGHFLISIEGLYLLGELLSFIFGKRVANDLENVGAFGERSEHGLTVAILTCSNLCNTNLSHFSSSLASAKLN